MWWRARKALASNCGSICSPFILVRRAHCGAWLCMSGEAVGDIQLLNWAGIAGRGQSRGIREDTQVKTTRENGLTRLRARAAKGLHSERNDEAQIQHMLTRALSES